MVQEMNVQIDVDFQPLTSQPKLHGRRVSDGITSAILNINLRAVAANMATVLKLPGVLHEWHPGMFTNLGNPALHSSQTSSLKFLHDVKYVNVPEVARNKMWLRKEFHMFPYFIWKISPKWPNKLGMI